MKSFSELTSASQVNNADLVAISQSTGNGYASKKTTVKDITDKSNLNLAEEYDSTSTYAVDDYVIYESVLYKCIASTTGTFDSAKWTSVVVTDEMGSGGGGGTGGHTIIDENGNLMTARSGLQFFGAVEVEDDAINNRTLVEVLGGDFYNPVIYSTEEREIGVWTDGKPLYEKTIDCGALPNNTTKTVSHGISNFGHMVGYSGVAFMPNINDIPIPFVHNSSLGDNVCFFIDSNEVTLRTSSDKSGYTASYITLRYTKTTDVAGSGTWTPQRVPAEHYTTDEQIIGTYLGETLYQRTFDLGSDLLVSTSSWTTLGITLDADKIIETKTTSTSGSFQGNILVYNDNGTWKGQTPRNGNDSSYVRYLTIAYTKSS